MMSTPNVTCRERPAPSARRPVCTNLREIPKQTVKSSHRTLAGAPMARRVESSHQPAADTMPKSPPIAPFSFADFLKTPPGHALAQWELVHFDAAVGNVFGAEALQIGIPELDTLRANRIHGHCVMMREDEARHWSEQAHPSQRAVLAEHELLPVESESVDLVTMPHALDFSTSPQQVLREAARILAPEGRLVLSAFNTMGLWWLRQRVGIAVGGRAYLPSRAQPIPLQRLQDWFALLGLEMDRGAFGIYVPGFRDAGRLRRWKWLDKAGDRWAPQCSNLFMLQAVKRVPGTRLITHRPRLTPKPARGKMPVPSAGMSPQTLDDAPAKTAEGSLQDTMP